MGENALFGAGVGAGFPLAISAGGAVARGVSNLGSLTASGRETIAQRMARGIIDEFAGSPLNIPSGTGEIVPGSKPTLAEVTGNPGVAGLQKALTDLNPSSPLLPRTEQNTTARSALFDVAKGTPQEKDRALAAVNAAARQAQTRIFPPGGPQADVTPVKQAIADVLSGPSGNRSDIKSAMADVLKVMEKDGQTITDPKTLYKSVRDEINHLISGKDLNKSYGKQAASELLGVRDSLDATIDAAAPGFKKYLQDQAAARAPVTSMETLQGMHITDAKGDITLAGVQRAIRSIDADVRASGIKPGKAVATAQREALESIRDDLLRRDKATARALHLGSSTVRNTINQQRLGLAAHVGPGALATLGGGAGEIIGQHVGAPGIGAMTGSAIGGLVGSRLPDVNALMRSAIQRNLEEMVLNPSSYAAAPQAGTGATNLFPRGVPPHVVPLAVIAKNRLLQR
jgi:hypothetical protein